MIAHFKMSSPLTMSDVRPRKEALRSFCLQSAINISDVLFKYVEGFAYVKDHSCFQHPAQRAIPKGHKTKFYCLRATTIEEASVEGNLLVHDDIYRVQLKLDPHDSSINNLAIPTFNDQLTNCRIQGAQVIRSQDVSRFEQRLIFQISLGLFHLVMNLIWALLATHRGTIDKIGSLTFFFAVLKKARLGSEHPDFHTLKAALLQILEGLLLNASIMLGISKLDTLLCRIMQNLCHLRKISFKRHIIFSSIMQLQSANKSFLARQSAKPL